MEDAAPSQQRGERVRPRRLEPDTLSYLKEVAETLVQSKDELTEEDAELMLWNVLEELAPRAASAASDRHAGELIETFLPRMSDGQLRYFLSKMEGYYSHLWTNRYSSHVLQNVLSRASAIVQKEVNGDDDDDNEGSDDDANDDNERLKDTPAMSEIVINMVSEVENEWLTLMNDVSASHVLRSVLALLAGRPLVAEKRGKKGKHRVVTFGEAPVSKDGTVLSYAVPASFEALYQQFLRKFRAASSKEMFNLMYDPNSGPLLAAALKLAPPKAQSKLAQHVLQWGDEDVSVRTFTDYAGDAVTSHFLEALFSSVSDDFFQAIFRRCISGKMLELSQHGIANYVVQNAIERVSSRELARDVLRELETALWTLLSKGRAGVVWRLVEMCRRVDLHKQEIYTLLVEAVKKQESKKPEAVQKDVVPALLSLQLATGGSSKVHLNVMGAKIISELLAFEYAAYLEPLYKGILSLNSAQLIALATDSTGSRCVIEPIWESEDADREWVRTELFAKFVGRFGELALDRLGAFSVIKCYNKLGLQDKATVAEELLAVEGKLSGSHFAQLVMNTVNLYEFRNNREKWEALYEKQDKIADMFKDVVGDEQEDAKTNTKTKKDKKAAKDKKPKDKKRKHASEETTEDITAIMGALRGSVDAKKSSKKSKKKQRREDDE